MKVNTAASDLSCFHEDFLSQMRSEGDPAADATVRALFDAGQAAAVRELMVQLGDNTTLLTAEALPPVAAAFFREHAELPIWANPARMARGAAFFERHAQAILSMLGALSLPYCYAGANGAQVLYLSQRIYRDASRRLAETAQFVLDVMAPEAFAPGGRGFASALKVRLMHAAVRFHILHSGKWNHAWGHPINQEDMAGTISAFSWICLRGLRKVGYFISVREADDFLHLWNAIGALMGVREALLPPNGKAAYWLDRRIVARQFRPSEAGTTLTRALLEVMQQNPAGSLPTDFIPTYMRFLLGDAVADLLEIPPGGSDYLIPLLQARNALPVLLGGNPRKANRTYREIRQGVQDALHGKLAAFGLPLSLGLN